MQLPSTFIALNPRTLENIYADILRLGNLTKRRSHAEKLIVRMKKNLAEIQKRSARAKTRRASIPKPGQTLASLPHPGSPNS